MNQPGRFELTGLQPEHRYDFELKFVRAGEETTVPDAAGSVRTYPADGTFGTFTFAFGSCANPDRQAAQGSWTGIRALADPAKATPVSLFAHLGDSFYFYDHMTEETVQNEESMHAAHVSMRRHIEFLDMARIVPCCGVWDDHDFAYDDSDRTDISDALRVTAKETWLKYWGNNQPISTVHDLGLATRISHGMVDIYLLDCRYFRDFDSGKFFGPHQIDALTEMIKDRADNTNIAPVVVLASGSNWNHVLDGKEDYGCDDYNEEREDLYQRLRNMMGREINGLILLSGDEHVNEIYHVELDDTHMAPEFVSSPLTKNSGLDDDGRKIKGERIASFPTGGSDGKRGFATLTIDATNSTPADNWTATVRYYQEAGAAMYEERMYRLKSDGSGQFEAI